MLSPVPFLLPPFPLPYLPLFFLSLSLPFFASITPHFYRTTSSIWGSFGFFELLVLLSSFGRATPFVSYSGRLSNPSSLYLTSAYSSPCYSSSMQLLECRWMSDDCWLLALLFFIYAIVGMQVNVWWLLTLGFVILHLCNCWNAGECLMTVDSWLCYSSSIQLLECRWMSDNCWLLALLFSIYAIVGMQVNVWWTVNCWLLTVNSCLCYSSSMQLLECRWMSDGLLTVDCWLLTLAFCCSSSMPLLECRWMSDGLLTVDC